MMDITEYWVESSEPDRDLLETYRESDKEQALNHAREVNGLLVRATFELHSTETLEDFTLIIEDWCEHGYYHETHDCPVCHK